MNPPEHEIRGKSSMTVNGVEVPSEEHTVKEPELITDDHSLNYQNHLRRLNDFYICLSDILIDFNEIIDDYKKTCK